MIHGFLLAGILNVLKYACSVQIASKYFDKECIIEKNILIRINKYIFSFQVLYYNKIKYCSNKKPGGKLMITNPVKLKSAVNNIDAELIINLLHNNNITCYKKSRGSGGYMNIYMGYSIYGEDIYVDKSDYDKANQLLNEISDAQELIPEDQDNDNTPVPFHKNPRIIARILLITMLGGMLLTVLLNIIY